MSTKKILVVILIVVLMLIFKVLYSLSFQTSNHISILKGITALDNENDIVQILDKPQKYLTKTDRGSSSIIKLMANKGWMFDEQLGSGYIFSKNDSKLIVISTQYTKWYTIWEFEM